MRKRATLIGVASLLLIAVAAYAAIDSADKRSAIIGWAPFPNGTIDAADRAELIEWRLPWKRMSRSYRGFFASGGASSGTTVGTTNFILILRRHRQR